MITRGEMALSIAETDALKAQLATRNYNIKPRPYVPKSRTTGPYARKRMRAATPIEPGVEQLRRQLIKALREAR